MPTISQLRLAFFAVVFTGFSVPFLGKAQTRKYPESAYPESYQLVLPKLIPYRLGNLWGYADSTGMLKIKPQYSYAEPFSQRLAIVHKGETANLINEQGKELFAWDFRNMYVWNNRLVFAETIQRQKGLYTVTGKEILPPKYREITTLKRTQSTAPNLIVAWTEQPPVPGLGGFSTSGPTEIYSLFTEEGKLIFGPEAYKILTFVGAGIIQTYKDGKFAAFDEKGNPLPVFDGYKLENFSKGVAVMSKEHKFGLIDSTGQVLVPPQYDDAKEFREGKVSVKSNGNWAFMDKTGKLLTPFKYAEPGYFMKSFAIVQAGRNGYGLIDSLGQEITPLAYSYIYGALPGKIYAFNTNNVVRYGLISKETGQIVMPEGLTEIKYFSEGLAVAVKDGKKGFIDENGKVVIPFEYVEAQGFKNGLAAVHNGKNWGVINRQQETVMPFIYESIEVVNPDRFVVWLFNRPAWGMKAMINAKGQEVAPLKYTDIGQPELDRIAIGLNGNWGMMDLNGRELMKINVLPAGYTVNGGLKNGIQPLINKQANKVGYRDWKGRVYFKD